MNTYNIQKFHVVATHDNQENKNNIINQFKLISNNNEVQVNFCTIYDSTRFNKIYIKQKNFPIHDSIFKLSTINTEWIGELDSLIQCINIANIANWPYVFVLNDSIVIDNDFNTKINVYLNNIDDFLCVVCGYSGKSDKSYNDNLSKITNGIIKPNSFLIKQNHYMEILNILNDTYMCSKESWLHQFENCYCLKNPLCTTMY